MEIIEIIIDKKIFSSEDIEELGIVENQCLKLVNFKNSSDLTVDDEVLKNIKRQNTNMLYMEDYKIKIKN